MQIYKIESDDVYLLYHPGEDSIQVGAQFLVTEKFEAEKDRGIIVQIIENESLNYPGIVQEIVQNSLESAFKVKNNIIINNEDSFSDIKSLKIAHGKIRKQMVDNRIIDWEGWIPTRNVDIKVMTNDEVIKRIVGEPSSIEFSLDICKYNEQELSLDATKLDMINVITGVKGSGKSHTAKNILLRLIDMRVPCIVFDVNNEYNFPNAISLRLGHNFQLDMSVMEPLQVFGVINSIFPLSSRTSENVENTIIDVFDQRRRQCESFGREFTIDMDYLLQNLEVLIPGGNQDYIRNMRAGLRVALNTVKQRNIFRTREDNTEELGQIYERCIKEKKFIRFDFSEMSSKLQKIAVEAVNNRIIQICNEEANKSRHLYPFIFFEEAHTYIDEKAIVDFATRGRHIGIRMFFMTNTPDALPEMIFRQLDNLFLLRLTHKNDIKHVSLSSFTDEETVKSITTRMPDRHLMVIGNITNNYPLVVQGNDLPDGTPATGVTRPLWEGIKQYIETNRE
ncbi:DUF87 domain-containing protein [Anoxybacillus rupiensis]|uniref:DUF87 domain-containing protein n=1 Tax=Anoxybacteroides rupiense TaxID=311460 RepID=A0ABT5W9Y2_9BACL|nr:MULTISPECIES: DUF87 domain-containing protein [Anoxybacillus]MBS2773168.1 ATP-binding protein [Anoxybacillus rupiensis]MDE8565629.1 DUF87 domain-containing protein [Anoxybacillus rupiensis]QHC02741.1 DUF87 domain-containing protein [Anoxybacillus sp. PDR2]